MHTRLITILALTFLCLGPSGPVIGDDSVAPPGPLSEHPTVAEICYALQDRSLSAFATITPKNRLAVESILRRIAVRQDSEIAQSIRPSGQADQTSAALNVLATILNTPADLAYFERFFERYDGTPASVAHEPYAKAINDTQEVLCGRIAPVLWESRQTVKLPGSRFCYFMCW